MTDLVTVSADSSSSQRLAGYAGRGHVLVQHLFPGPHSKGQTAAPVNQVPKPAVQKRTSHPGRADTAHDSLSDHTSANSEQAVTLSLVPLWSSSLLAATQRQQPGAAITPAAPGGIILNSPGVKCRWSNFAHVRLKA